MGFGITHDGTTWEALPPPEMTTPAVHWAEVGAVEYIPYVAASVAPSAQSQTSTSATKGRYYALIGAYLLTYRTVVLSSRNRACVC